MRARVALVVVALGAIACGGRQQGGGEATCADAAGGAARTLRAARPAIARAELDPAPELKAACAADRWSGAARTCFRDAAGPVEARRCADLLSPPQRAHARAIQAELTERAAVALRGAAGAASTGIPECDRYIAAMDALIACERTPAAVREALAQGKDAMQSAWKDLERMDRATRAQARAATAQSCAQATAAIQQSGQAWGC